MRPKLALVLGGGGSRGLAHIGVLDVLVREKIPIDYVVGTSMGAIIGAYFALGIPPKLIAAHLRDMQGNNLLNLNIFSARARQRDLKRRLESILEDKTFNDLSIPMTIMTVDMVTGQEIMVNTGELVPAILASSAVPAVFPPVEVNGMQLADGGVIDSLSTHAAYHVQAEKIIAVDVYPPLELDDLWVDPLSAIMGFQLPFNLLANTDWAKIPSMASSMWRAVRVMTWHVHQTRLEAHPPDVLLRPEVGRYGSLDFTDVEGPLQAGQEAAMHQLGAIRALLV